MKYSEKMNLLKKGEGAPLLNFERSLGVPLLNFEGGPGVSLLNFQGDPHFETLAGSWVPLLKLRGCRVPRSQVPESCSHFYTMPSQKT